ncbi:MAG: ABC transporter permease subunit [Clostridiales bacterium]|nr:ABC transporter permease subunit [Candidatus Blautia equi]
MRDGGDSISVDGTDYKVEVENDNSVFVYDKDGNGYAYICDMNITNTVSGIYLTPDYKLALMETIEAGENKFVFGEGEDETEYTITNKNGEYIVKRDQETKVIDDLASPSAAHICGTDGNGMDLLARLMYGGRISLLIGFVVVFIETFLGVLVGGTAGFFGGWVDNFLMRVVDVIYCIPVMPLYLILGSVMDYYQVSSTARIYLLCVIMSVVGWVGIARIVRGQILSLREQEFMVAAEATGISVRRRIFKHLVPNVIPQLIVFASMGLGDIILTEAALSFLGLGVKYPAASWGSIINAVNDTYVMRNYPFVWIPAGFLILLTVLAFNFIGDGLRDAFDPKMKR